jgi:hypothetical protein
MDPPWIFPESFPNPYEMRIKCARNVLAQCLKLNYFEKKRGGGNCNL